MLLVSLDRMPWSSLLVAIDWCTASEEEDAVVTISILLLRPSFPTLMMPSPLSLPTRSPLLTSSSAVLFFLATIHPNQHRIVQRMPIRIPISSIKIHPSSHAPTTPTRLFGSVSNNPSTNPIRPIAHDNSVPYLRLPLPQPVPREI